MAKNLKQNLLIGVLAVGMSISGLHYSAQAQENTDPAPEEMVELPFRYLNQKCEFSYKLPAIPSAEVLWGSDDYPVSFVKNPGFGETGEKTSYKASSFDGKDFFFYETTCLFADKETMEAINVRDLKAELTTIQDEKKLKNADIEAQEMSRGLSAARLSGFTVDSKTELVTSHHYELYIGRRSILYVEAEYTADKMDNSDTYKAIRDSFLYEPIKH